MKNLIIALLLSLVMIGCGGMSVKGAQIAEVPIKTKCTPTLGITEIKEYPYDRATKTMDLYDKLQLALAELGLVKGQNTELKAALGECTK